MKIKEIFSLHPFLFAIFPTIFIFSINSQEIKFEQVGVILLIILAITVGIFLGFRLFIKNKNHASFITSIGVLLFFSYGHIFNLLSSNFLEIRLFTLTAILISIFLVIFVISIIYFGKTKRKLDNATKIANGIAIVLIVISLSNIVSDNAQGNYSLDFVDINQNSATTQKHIDGKPDVYYIVLDAYAGNDILEKYFGYDNSEFTKFLEESDFSVISEATSNYPTTYLSLSSSLNMEHLRCIEKSSSCISPSAAFQKIQNNKVMKKFNDEGYVIINSNSGWMPTRYFEIANSNLCHSYGNILSSELFITIISNSALNPVYVKLFEDEKRELILCNFSELEEIHKKYEKPIFILAHFVLPHHPYVFGPNGEPVSPEKLEIGWEGLEKDKEGYLNQVKFANKKLKEIITKIIDESEIPPIIIVQGDHGLKSKIEDWDNPTKKEMYERFSILNAYHIPNYSEKIDETITPVNSFRIISNQLFNEDLEILPDKNYWLHEGPPSYFEDVSTILK